jgi:hypothetical protein
MRGSAKGSDLPLAACALAAAAFVLVAPLLGRAGHPLAADLAMAAAAACGVASFALAGVATVRSARRRKDETPRSGGSS